jgi:flagellar hook-basal body complex protein FliE
MIRPVSLNCVSPVGPASGTQPAAGTASPERNGFADTLRQQLEQVNQMQAEAEAGVQDLVSGRTDNLTAVLNSTRKAEVAFSLLMEIRNKLVDAYTDLKQLRV